MDDQKPPTFSIKKMVDKRGYNHVFRTITVTLVSTLLLSACYLFIPLSVIWVAARAPSSFEWLAALASIPSIWFIPGFVAIALATIMELAAGQGDENVERGWILGIIVGSTILTAVWFLPLWDPTLPDVAEKIQVLRVPALFDDTWLMALSWLVSVPLMTYADLAAHTETDASSSSSNSKQKEQQPSSNNHSKRSTKSAERTDLQGLTYRWKPAPDTRFKDIGGMEGLKTEM